MKTRLYLDDLRTPKDTDWLIVRSYEDFVNQIKRDGLSSYETISLDHDLGDTQLGKEEKTGYDCAKFLVDWAIQEGEILPQVYVHSANPIGAANIMGYINGYLKYCGLPQTCVQVNIQHTTENH